MSYRNVETIIWNDDKFPFCSPQCHYVWFHLFTHPRSTSIGIYQAGIEGLSEEYCRNGSSREDYMKGFHEALEKGFLEYDPKALLIFFPKYFTVTRSGNKPQSPNVVKYWAKLFRQLPESPLKQKCSESIHSYLKGFREAFLKAFTEGFPYPYSYSDSYSETDSRQEDLCIGQLKNFKPLELKGLWNRYAGILPKVLDLTKKRQEKSRLRIREHPNEEFWETLFIKIQTCEFLLGDSDGGWKASFDWIIQNSDNCLKVLEGKCDRVKGPAQKGFGVVLDRLHKAKEQEKK